MCYHQMFRAVAVAADVAVVVVVVAAAGVVVAAAGVVVAAAGVVVAGVGVGAAAAVGAAVDLLFHEKNDNDRQTCTIHF